MAWIESHQELGAHPKTRRLARALKCSIPAAIGHLHCLWWWALDYAQDGNLAGLDLDDIAVACMWEGDPEVLVAALSAARFVDEDGHLHDWQDYAGKLIDRRVRNRERMATVRNAHVQRTDDARVRLQNSTVPYSTVPPTPPPPARESAPAQGAATAATRAPRAPRPTNAGPKPMTTEQRETLLTTFASIPDVETVLETALAHKARLKCASEYLYARNWLRTELQRYEEHEARMARANGRPPSMKPAIPDEYDMDAYLARQQPRMDAEYAEGLARLAREQSPEGASHAV